MNLALKLIRKIDITKILTLTGFVTTLSKSLQKLFHLTFSLLKPDKVGKIIRKNKNFYSTTSTTSVERNRLNAKNLTSACSVHRRELAKSALGIEST